MKFTHLFLIAALLVAAPVSWAQEEAGVKGEEMWSVRCQENGEGDKTSCEIFQRLAVHETGRRFAEFAIGFPAGKDVARGVLILPLGILLQPGGRLKVGENEPVKFTFRFCRNDGCYAVVSLDDALIESMKKGDKMTVAFATLEGKAAGIAFSLNGFTKAMEELRGS